MTSLNEAIKEAIRQYRKEIDVEFKTLVASGNLRIWKGRKVVSVKRWNKLVESQNFSEIFQYIPNQFANTATLRDMPDTLRATPEYTSWNVDNCEYLDKIKDPSLGRLCCDTCILLSPIKDELGFFDVMIKHYEKTTKCKTSAPCIIENFFKCPYDQGKNGLFLLDLGDVLMILYEIINVAVKETEIEDSLTIEVDFEAKTVQTLTPGYRSYVCSFRELLEHYSESSVKIRSKKDIFMAITNKNILENLIERYLRSRNKPFSYGNNKALQRVVKRLKNDKNFMVEFILSIGTFKELDDLKNDEMPFFEKIDDKTYYAGLDDYWDKESETAVRRKKMGSFGECNICGRSANIACANCSIWMCTQHWQQHGSSVHGFVLEEQSEMF